MILQKMENYIKTRDFFNRKYKKKLQRVIPEYLKHKGHRAEVYKFTTQLFKEPDFKIAGFKIAILRGEYLGKDCIYYSLVY